MSLKYSDTNFRWFVTLCIVLNVLAAVNGVILGTACRHNTDCKVSHSRCDRGACACEPFYAQANDTTCLESSLLGTECVVSEQCSLKVAYSACLDGVCRCTDGHLQFRKHTCLSPAPPGHVCYSNEHCRLWDKESHCEFVIPNLFGRCGCNSYFRHIGDRCKSTKIAYGMDAISGEDEAIVIESSSGPAPTGTPLRQPKPPSYLNPGSEDPFGPPNELVDTDDPKPTKNPVSNEVLSTEDIKLPQLPLKQQATAQIPITNRKNGESNGNSDNGEIAAQLHANDQPIYRVVTQPSIEKKGIKKGNPKLPSKPYKTGHQKKSSLKDKQRIRTDASEILDLGPASLGMSCVTDAQCEQVDANTRCLNKRCDCAFRTNSTAACSARNRGCLPGTFQCRATGACISWYFVCDGRKDCPDGSDEKCEGIGKDGTGERCPMHSFRCGGPGSKCVSRASRCDGKPQCPGGEDERNCHTTKRRGCPRHTFRCGSGECLPEYEFCNAIVSCKDASDEAPHQCNEQSRWRAADFCPLRCGNGRCRSTAVACSGRDGCGDNSDEIACTVCKCPAPQEVL